MVIYDGLLGVYAPVCTVLFSFVGSNVLSLIGVHC